MKAQGGYIKRVGALYQVLLWLLFYLVFIHAFFHEFNIEREFKSILVYTIVFVGYVLISFVNIRVLLPKYFEDKRYGRYALFLLLTLIVSSFLLNLFVVEVLDITVIKLKSPHLGWVGYFFFFGLLYVGLGSFFHFFAHWHYLRENMITYEKEKIDAELTALKAQINPHLLFNSLNNIYSLSLDKSDKTPELILKLSDLMSYVLYDCKKAKVNIKSELEFIDNYIQLEKIRFENNIDIQYDKKVSYNDVKIAPLVFLPFIENAFKHAGNKGSEIPIIKFSLKLNSDHTIYFTSENTVCNVENIEKNPYSGIGIQNITKRLTYLYPEQHKLEIESKEEYFKVSLKIEL